MSESREQKIETVKQKLALVETSIANAKNKAAAGHVINPGVVSGLFTERAQLQTELKKLESSPEADTKASSSQSAPLVATTGGADTPSDEKFGIPEELRIPRRPYTMSQAALEQRKRASTSQAHADAMKGNQNAWKTGEHAQGFIRQIFRPCKSTCTQYPCKLIEEGNTEPGEACLDKEEFMRSLSAMQKAVKEGKAEDIKDLAALRISGVWEVVRMLTEDVLTDNTIVKSQKLNKDGDVIGFEVKPHPSLLALGKLVEVSGLTAPEWMVTPRQIAKNDTDEKANETLATLMGKVARIKTTEEKG